MKDIGDTHPSCQPLITQRTLMNVYTHTHLQPSCCLRLTWTVIWQLVAFTHFFYPGNCGSTPLAGLKLLPWWQRGPGVDLIWINFIEPKRAIQLKLTSSPTKSPITAATHSFSLHKEKLSKLHPESLWLLQQAVETMQKQVFSLNDLNPSTWSSKTKLFCLIVSFVQTVQGLLLLHNWQWQINWQWKLGYLHRWWSPVQRSVVQTGSPDCDCYTWCVYCRFMNRNFQTWTERLKATMFNNP